MDLIAKPIVKDIFTSLKERTAVSDLKPRLVIIQSGNDPASDYYVENLIKKGNKIGIDVKLVLLEENVAQSEFQKKLELYSDDQAVNGIMIQKPLPSHLNEQELIRRITYHKDIDGIHPVNLGNIILEEPGFLPSTPAAVLELIRFYQIETSGKHVVILGRSSIVGKPLANLLIQKNKTGNATVTVCHSRTVDLEKITRQADILIAAIGKANFVKPDMIKKGAVIIDVGINQITSDDGNISYVGDVDYKKCCNKASAITPVPGGVGSVTTALLLANVVKAWENQQESDNFIDENIRRSN
ncbi:MAG: bifunctional 5,10-methylenetetrahydrofolate dehydrogenase/5,10-methenyltetrahydrofolate cyclohydrolase [Candidatus Cloacimonetes bacterium]|nr:bifunctional 5,10-methylenetetrahydrofolate dehydrogenase/5,10-methenyltetrahydrofolate cyclohydrolase [Candidatus Cloacimonadota bacterium]